MSMSTYKSLGGPPSGLIVTNERALAERLDQIAFPGLTANFDAAKSAALAMTLLDWRVLGRDYASTMKDCAQALAAHLHQAGIPVFAANRGYTTSHQFAIEAAGYGGGQAAARLLRRANILTCGIGLPGAAVADDMNGLRIGTPEIARWGMTPADMPTLGALIASVLSGRFAPEAVAPAVTDLRRQFKTLKFVR
jgi:glycine hydroxymethyltransferase